MQKKIKALNGDLRKATIDNESLIFKINDITENVVNMTEFEKLQSDLNIANSLIKYKTGKIEG